jgi:hypothetical protein
MQHNPFPTDDYETLAKEIDSSKSDRARKAISEYSERVRVSIGRKSRNPIPDMCLLNQVMDLIQDGHNSQAKALLREFTIQVSAFVDGIPRHLR